VTSLSRNTGIYGTRNPEAPKSTALPECVPEDPVILIAGITPVSLLESKLGFEILTKLAGTGK
jgi:hypothetical protein